MVFSLNCLISGQTSDYIINVPIGDFFLSEENTKIKFTDMTVANLKDQISRTKEVIEDKITKMNLWKVELTTYEADNLSAEDIESHERSEKMVTTSNLDKYFNNNEDKNPKKGYLHVFIVPTATDLGRKGRNTEVETTSRKRRSWAINSTIANELRDSVYFVDTTETSGPLRDMIQKGEFVALYGTRASGKSTRVDQAIFKLKSEGYVCIYVTLEGVNISTTDIFWSSLGTKLAINAPNYFKYNEVKSSDDFMFKFRKSNWESDVVFFIDEYDVLLEANDDIKSSFLGTIRNIKNSKRDYAILSSVAIGPLSILFLKSDKINVPPFNVIKPFRNPNFTLAQVESLYKEYEDDNKLTIVPEVIKDIYEQTNGHAGLVCLCGRAIQNNLEKKLDESRRLDFNTLMVGDLSKPKAKEALDLLRSVFLGFFDFVQIEATEERRLADFLTTMGVLVRDNENKFSYKMSSMLIDRLIRRDVISELYNSRPTVPVPQTHEGSLKIIDTLIEAVRCFDKTIIHNAFKRSFKKALVEVDGYLHTKVPRESVYDTELYRILVNWIVNECNFVVTGQHHLIDHVDNDEKGKHYYSDITIMSEDQTAVLELLASATKNELNEHFERILNYAEMLSANDIWIVNFTCEDNATK
ncbi:hypothetical protein RhiirA1_522996 [Rhizophagus irregularis]|uniref:Crinkler effector protein N-terminal domain-containing protein n=1 Tax=Rhizophagus irregularis TaxID=588596 RepID=A0A2I1ENC4_9GLOM|nr:hypothetical protein RhiirA1_522996 [Rhizophagus irregularis]PKY23623.1 hypothetical protein RhiirB3_387370 [Rhizophagus irregularis]